MPEHVRQSSTMSSGYTPIKPNGIDYKHTKDNEEMSKIENFSQSAEDSKFEYD